MSEKKKSCDANGRSRMIPKEVCHQCLWIVRDMERLEKLEKLGEYMAGTDELVLYETEYGIAAEGVINNAKNTLDCIRRAEESVPEFYRKGILDNIIFRTDFDVNAHLNTWQKWKRVFLHELARNLMLI